MLPSILRKKHSVILAIFLLCLATNVSAELNAVLFTEVRVTHDSENNLTSEDVDPFLDIFVSANWDAINVLVEYFTNENSGHFERLQVGYNTDEDIRFWLGRFHNPFGYWHTQYHHGNFLQTSITRPSIDELGASGGILPAHIFGGLLEGSVISATYGWDYSLAYGYGPVIKTSDGGHHGEHTSNVLSDVDVSDVNIDDHGKAGTLRLAFLPDALGSDEYGAFITHAEIPAVDLSFNDITLTSVGLFCNTQWQTVRLIFSAYHTETVISTSVEDEKFYLFAGYIQLEKKYSEAVTVFARVEDTHNEENNEYLHTLDLYVPQREVLGIRYNLGQKHALKFEWDHNHREHSSEDRYYVNWTAAFP